MTLFKESQQNNTRNAENTVSTEVKDDILEKETDNENDPKVLAESIKSELSADERDINEKIQEYKKIDESSEWVGFVNGLFDPMINLIDGTKKMLDSLNTKLSKNDFLKINALIGISLVGISLTDLNKAEAGVEISMANQNKTELSAVKGEIRGDEKLKQELVVKVQERMKESTEKKYGINKEKYSEILGEHELLKDYNYDIGGMQVGFYDAKPLDYRNKDNFTTICDLSLNQSLLKDKMKFIKIRKDWSEFDKKIFSSQEEREEEMRKINKKGDEVTINDLSAKELVLFLEEIKQLDVEAQFFEFIQKTNVYHEEEHYLFDQYLFKDGYEGPSKMEVINFLKKQLLADELLGRNFFFDDLIKIYKLDKKLILDTLKRNDINFDNYDLAVNESEEHTAEVKGVLQMGFLLDEYLARIYNAEKGFNYSRMKDDFNNHPSKNDFEKYYYVDNLSSSFINPTTEEKEIISKMKIKGTNILDIGKKIKK